ncbi:hypothetical protein [Curtobacterium sp. MCSS17_015]|uniref:hypothetical protein n=1 Tax=Curtobacterium sp. MCSS17_015 TaxID=2175666 RepID=UPI0015E897A9|nr:hypothetical protein [Curtobacterium sp. MCSS17_015]WIB25854.1 hypothetical protein DEJ18_12460 [Curtobacterium sp. MCSS17_015]
MRAPLLLLTFAAAVFITQLFLPAAVNGATLLAAVCVLWGITTICIRHDERKARR